VRKIPDSTKTSLHQRLTAHARQHWSTIDDITVRFRANFAYIDGQIDGETTPLCGLRYAGSASLWGFAIWRASHNDYEDSYLPNGMRAGSPEDALDCAAHAPRLRHHRPTRILNHHRQTGSAQPQIVTPSTPPREARRVQFATR